MAALRYWVCWFIFLFVLGYLVPYTLLGETANITGSFLFWIFWGVAAIASMFVLFLRWREDDSDNRRGQR